MERNRTVGYREAASSAPVANSGRGSLGGSAGIAWIHGEPEGDGWGVEVRGEVVPAIVQADPFHDPRGERLRG